VSIGRRLKKPLIRAYERYGHRARLDRLESAIASAPHAVNAARETDGIEGEAPPIRFLVGTSAAGLLLFDGARMVRLFDGYPRTEDGSGGYYGISHRDGRWFVYQAILATGRVISFRLEGDRAVDVRAEIEGLPRAIHQIDFIDDELWIIATFHNRIIVVPAAAIGKHWREAARVYHPTGARDILLGNTSHFNSVYGADGAVHVVAHNETHKTGKPSEAFVLDRAGRVLERRDLVGGSCHNIAPVDGGWVTCWSWEGSVGVDGREVLSLGGFTRGLALGSDHHVVGASGVATRATRDQADSRIVITDAGFRPVATLHVARTQVHEIRRVDSLDLGLSPPVRT
jgi:hypothetical protein